MDALTVQRCHPDEDSIILAALGTMVRLRCPDPVRRSVFGVLLAALVEHGAEDSETRDIQEVSLLAHGSGGFVLHHPDGRTKLGIGAEVSGTLRQLNFLFISRMPYFGAHAAVLGGARGAVVLPGHSGLGKSTATAAGLLAGLGYLSDEALAVDWHSGIVARPYPRPMALSDWSRQELGLGPVIGPADPETGEQYVGPLALTSRIDPPSPVSDIVLLGPFGDRTELRPARRSEVAAELLRRSFNAWQDPSAAFRTAHRLASQASGWMLERSAPAETGAVLKEAFGSDV